MPKHHLHQFAFVQAEYADAEIDARRNDKPIIVAEGQRRDGAAHLPKSMQKRPGLSVPEFDRRVRASCGKILPIL